MPHEIFWRRRATANNLVAIKDGTTDFIDFDGDGYCDLLYSGITGGGAGNVTKLSEYNPITNAHTDSAFDVSDVQNAEVEFSDIDGDKDLDFVIVGKNKNHNSNDSNNINGISKPFIFRTYINVRNDSAEVLASTTEKQMISLQSLH